MQDQTSLFGLPDELFVKVVSKLVVGVKPHEAFAEGTPALCVSKDDVPSLWALVNTSRNVREHFARCLQHCRTRVVITYDHEVVNFANKRLIRVVRNEVPGFAAELWRTQWRHRCKPFVLRLEDSTL